MSKIPCKEEYYLRTKGYPKYFCTMYTTNIKKTKTVANYPYGRKNYYISAFQEEKSDKYLKVSFHPTLQVQTRKIQHLATRKDHTDLEQCITFLPVYSSALIIASKKMFLFPLYIILMSFLLYLLNFVYYKNYLFKKEKMSNLACMLTGC